VKRSADDFADVPWAVVTVTSTVPLPFGEVTVTNVAVCPLMVAALDPK
jgi:hypothetical protein